MQQSFPAPPAVPSNGVVAPRSGPHRWINVAVASASLVAAIIVIVRAVRWDGGTQSDPEVRSIVGLALAVLVLAAVVQAVIDATVVGLLLARQRAGFVLHVVAAVTAAVPVGIGVPLGWWWPAVVAPVALVAAVAALGSAELR